MTVLLNEPDDDS